MRKFRFARKGKTASLIRTKIQSKILQSGSVMHLLELRVKRKKSQRNQKKWKKK
jgi:hypothetical protein